MEEALTSAYRLELEEVTERSALRRELAADLQKERLHEAEVEAAATCDRVRAREEQQCALQRINAQLCQADTEVILMANKIELEEADARLEMASSRRACEYDLRMRIARADATATVLRAHVANEEVTRASLQLREANARDALKKLFDQQHPRRRARSPIKVDDWKSAPRHHWIVVEWNAPRERGTWLGEFVDDLFDHAVPQPGFELLGHG